MLLLRGLPSSTRITDEDVRAFYAHRGGARMFDALHHTPEVAAYLGAELDPLADAPDFDHLVEIGCGSGLHLDWAVERGLHYDGLDLVAQLVDEGRARLAELARPHDHARHRRFHLGSAEDLGTLWSTAGLEGRHHGAILAFPFNCAGSLARPETALGAAARTQARIYISVFAASRPATACRLAYYARCGYAALATTDTEHGVLVTSLEGLRSFAYHERHLVELLARSSYVLERRSELAGVGVGLLFAPASG